MRIWLHEVTGTDNGWNAWCLDLMGFATWGHTRSEVPSRVPTKITEYQDWLGRHETSPVAIEDSIRVEEHIRGNEILFSPDSLPCEQADLAHAVSLLSASRRDLISIVSSLPAAALSWDPPYRSFAPWARWRSIREILAHVANTETHYYLPKIRYMPQIAPAAPGDNWESYLPAHREQTVRCLQELSTACDRSRVSHDGEAWSVRKVLRRLVRHELLHWKSICRIGRDNSQAAP